MTTQLAARPITDSNPPMDNSQRLQVLEAELEQTKHLSEQLTQQLLKTEELASDWETKYYDAMEEIESQNHTIEQLSANASKRRKKSSSANKPHVNPRQKYPLLDLYYNPRTAQFFQPGQQFVVQLWKGNALTWGVAKVAEGNVIVSAGDEKTTVQGFGLQIIGYFIANKKGTFQFTRVYKTHGMEKKETYNYSIRPAPEEFMYETTASGKKTPIIYGVPNQLITAGGPVHTMLMKISESDGRLKAYEGRALSRSGWGHIMAIGLKSEKIEFLDKGYTYVDSKGQKRKVDYSYYQPTLKDIKSLYSDDENRTKTSKLLRDHFAEAFGEKTSTRKRTMDMLESDSEEDEPPKKKMKTNDNVALSLPKQQSSRPNTTGTHSSTVQRAQTTSTRESNIQAETTRRTQGGKNMNTAQKYKQDQKYKSNTQGAMSEGEPEQSEDEEADDENEDSVENSDDEYEREEQATQHALAQAQQLA
uniref:Uncharacterized protein n=1 Tax=Clandestinovirus TaxID=2831644 RepID=A0A8F8PNF2_9VIRU|nr:hypothetical protein KOM_12_504 [Clandestinovirus]